MERTWQIGEVSQRTGLTRRTLRHYDDLGLLVPSARSWGDYRLYDENDLLRLLQIQNLKALGLSLAEIGEALADPTLDASRTLRSHLDLLRERIAAEQLLADRLQALAETTERSWDDVLDAIALTRLQSHADPILRLRAALVPDGRSDAELFAALESETDPGVQEVLIWALAQRPGAGPFAAQRLPSASGRARRALVRLLGKTGTRSALPQLVAALDEPDPVTVSAAVTALAALGDPTSAAPLAGLLAREVVGDAALIDALVAIGPPAVSALAAIITTGSAAARAAAAETIGRLGPVAGPDGCRALAPALADTDPDVRRTALVALADLGDPGLAVVATMVADPTLGRLAQRLLEVHAG